MLIQSEKNVAIKFIVVKETWYFLVSFSLFPGIGMGLHGCDASRDAADVILTGDSFDSIVSAIEEGTVFYVTFFWSFTFSIFFISIS